jgi:Succinylglutamate desuccinylase / Aspartoacylase family
MFAVMRNPSELRVVIGHSIEGREIVLWETNAGGDAPRTLLVGGLHGDEMATITLLETFRARVPEAGPVAILPLANPDGFERRTRYNARGVDLNRNCDFNWRSDSVEPSGTAPWSEQESRVLRDFILSWRPAKIVSLHWALAEVEADGVHSAALATAMWEAMSDGQRRPYRLRIPEPGMCPQRGELTNVECPGSFGQWCGYSLEYADGSLPAMVTLELPAEPESVRPAELPDDHVQTLHVRYARDEAGYLRAVEPGVHAMLDAACRLAVL